MKKLLWCCGIVLLAASALASGRIEVVGSDTVDFGKYPAREKKVAKYKIKNSGDAILKILKVRKTCACAYAKTDKTELQPGETATIEVGILPNSIFNRYSKNTFVESSDDKTPFLKLVVAGNAVPLVEIRPNQFTFLGRIPADREWSQVFDLIATQQSVKLGKVMTDANQPVKAVMKPVGGTENPHYKLSVTLPPVLNSGDFKCTIQIPFLTPANQPPVKLGLTGKIGRELNCVPGRLFFQVSNKPVTKKFTVWVLGQNSRVLKPEELILPEHDEISFEVHPDKRRGGLTINATFSAEFTKTLYAEKEMRFQFTVPNAASGKLICRTEEKKK